TLRPNSRDGAQGQHSVAEIADVGAVNLFAGEVLEEIRVPRPRGVDADEGSLQLSEPVLPSHCGVHEPKRPVEVAAIERLDALYESIDVLLRPRLLREPGGFEGFGSLLEHPKASDLLILDCEHERASRDHLDPLAPAKGGAVRHHDLGTRLRDVVRLKLAP